MKNCLLDLEKMIITVEGSVSLMFFCKKLKKNCIQT